MSMNMTVGDVIKMVKGEKEYNKALAAYNAKTGKKFGNNNSRHSQKPAAIAYNKPSAPKPAAAKTETLIPFDDDNYGGY